MLAENSSSPTRAAIRTRLLEAMPQARWYEDEPLSDDNEREGSIQAFGAPFRTHYRLDKAEIIVCVDSDLLCMHPNGCCTARASAQGRDPDSGPMNRLSSSRVATPPPVPPRTIGFRCRVARWRREMAG